MAYVVPETQQPVPLYFANRDAFVLSLPALRQDLQSSRAIPYPLDETVYRARKSTRQFTAEALSAETINSLYEALPGWLTQQMAQERAAACIFGGLLAVCAAFRSPQRALPKYRYPSASSPMRCKCISGSRRRWENMPRVITTTIRWNSIYTVQKRRGAHRALSGLGGSVGNHHRVICRARIRFGADRSRPHVGLAD